MAFTEANITAIDEALVALATGTRAVSVSVNGKSIQYGQADIADLLSLKSVMQQDLGLTYTRTYAKNVGANGN